MLIKDFYASITFAFQIVAPRNIVTHNVLIHITSKNRVEIQMLPTGV